MTEASLKLAPLSTGSELPLYEQIVEAIRREVANGRLLAGSAMPSFRELATQLAVSLITVTRAYEELEREGILVCRQGLGTFVAENASDRSRSERHGTAVEALRTAVRTGREAGLDDRELLELLKRELRSASPESPKRRQGGQG
jgi:GntR family transcriptional regulator